MTARPTRPRARIDDRHQWDLTTVYESPEEWEMEYERTATLADALESDLETAFETDQETALDSPETLAAVLERFEDLVRREQRLALYAELARNYDLTDDAAERRRGRARRLSGEVEAVTTDLRRLLRTREERVDRLRAESSPRAENDSRSGGDVLEPFDRFLADATRLPGGEPGVERLVAEFADVFDSHDRIVTAIRDADVDPPTVEGPDGDPVEVRAFDRTQLLGDSDRAFRRRVYEAFHDALDERANAMAATVAEKATARAALAEARGFDSAREAALNRRSYPETGYRIALPTAVHDVLCETVRENLDPFHRLQERRRERLGVDRLRPWDLSVRLADAPEPELPYGTARAHVLEAVSALDEGYRDRLETLLDERRIDVYPAEDKRHVTYCPMAYDAGPFVSTAYDGTVRSLFHFAHELGHAMQAEYLREARRPLYATTARPVEEVASTTHELLLARHLLEAANEGDTAAAPSDGDTSPIPSNGGASAAPSDGDASAALAEHVRGRLRTILAGNLVGSARWAAFTRRTYGLVEDGAELTRDRLDDVYADLYREWYPSVDPDGRTPSEWLAAAHERAPYHHYQYPLGVVGALAVVDRLEDGSLSPADYRAFLETGATARSLEQFETLGVDPTTPGPYERALGRLGSLLP